MQFLDGGAKLTVKGEKFDKLEDMHVIGKPDTNITV